MFFVACSLSDDRCEFDLAVQRFLGCLRPGAPFAAAFMTGSDGYETDGVRFPAVSLGPADIEKTISPLVTGLDVRPIESEVPLRPGVGMVLTTGISTGPADLSAGARRTTRFRGCCGP
jgi:hypothetical protein